MLDYKEEIKDLKFDKFDERELTSFKTKTITESGKMIRIDFKERCIKNVRVVSLDNIIDIRFNRCGYTFDIIEPWMCRSLCELYGTVSNMNGFHVIPFWESINGLYRYVYTSSIIYIYQKEDKPLTIKYDEYRFNPFSKEKRRLLDRPHIFPRLMVTKHNENKLPIYAIIERETTDQKVFKTSTFEIPKDYKNIYKDNVLHFPSEEIEENNEYIYVVLCPVVHVEGLCHIPWDDGISLDYVKQLVQERDETPVPEEDLTISIVKALLKNKIK